MSYLLDRVAFSVFGIDVYWYGVIIASAIFVAFMLCFVLCKKRGLNTDLPIDIFLAVVPLGIVCARLFSVLFDADTTILDFFAFRNGGMSIIGAVIGGVVGIFILSKIKKLSFFAISDVVAPVLILAQAIGRWGNFANGEVFGLLVENPAWQWFPFAVEVYGEWHLALFFYEFVLNLIGAVLLWVLLFKTDKLKIVTATYLIYYGAIRVVLESLREPQFILRLWGLPISQIVSGIFAIVGIIILIDATRRRKV